MDIDFMVWRSVKIDINLFIYDLFIIILAAKSFKEAIMRVKNMTLELNNCLWQGQLAVKQ